MQMVQIDGNSSCLSIVSRDQGYVFYTAYVNHTLYGAVLTDYGKLLTKKALKLIYYQLVKYNAEKEWYQI